VDVAIEGQGLAPIQEVICDRKDLTVTRLPNPTANRVPLRIIIPETAAPGPVKITIKTKGGTVSIDRFQVRLRWPLVSRVAPDSVARGTEADLVVTGSNLLFTGQDTKVTVDPPVKARISGKPTEKSLTIHVVVPPDTPPGPRAILLETTDGKVSTQFNVLLAPPSVASVVPAQVARGSTAKVTIQGKNLAGSGAVQLAIPDPSFFVGAAGPATAAALPLEIVAKPEAVPGPRTLVIQTPDGVVTATVLVTTPPVRLAKLVPAGVARGTESDLDVVVEGAPAAPTIRLLPEDPGVALLCAPGAKPRLVVAKDARPGPRTIVAETPYGVVTGTVAVNLRGPSIAALEPAAAPAGSTTEIDVQGQGIEGASIALAVPDPAIEIGPGPRPQSLKVTVRADATPGPRPLVVRTPDGAAVATLVVPGASPLAPVVSEVSPSHVPRGGPFEVGIAGLHLRSAGDKPPEVTVLCEGAPIPAEVVASASTTLKVKVTPPPDAAIGGAVLLVRTSEGIAAGALTVMPASPSIASASPLLLSRPGQARIALEGANLAGAGPAAATTLLLARPDGSEPIKAVLSAGKPGTAEVLVTLDAAARPGDYVLSISTSEGGAATVVTVGRAAPSLASVDPGRMGLSGNAVFTLRGANLLAPGGKPPEVAITRVGGPSNLRPQIVSAAADALEVRVLTVPGTPAGPHVIVVRTPDGAAASLFAIVNGTHPLLSGMTPAEGRRLETTTSVLRGIGLQGLSRVTFSGEGVSAVVLPGGTDGEVTLRITGAGDAAPGPRTYGVETQAGFADSGKSVFTVR
jgi:hypothetical protein